MKEIILSKGQVALVSDHRFEYLGQWKWSAKWSPGSQSYYAVRKDHSSGHQKNVHMGRVIAQTPDEMECDHIDGNTLNNQDGNLRNVTHQQNCMNRRAHRDSSSNYNGVSWSNRAKRWRVSLRKEGKCVFDKTFKDVLVAARAYDEAAKEHFGEFARLNFPKP